MKKITVYEKPTCPTCRKTIKILTEMEVPFNKINYFIEPFSKNILLKLLKKMKMQPSDLLRKNDKAYKTLDMKNNKYTEEEILEFMLKDQNLIQRPIVELGEKAILGRPPEKIKELLS